MFYTNDIHRLLVLGLDLGFLSHGQANSVLPSLSWSQRLPVLTAMGEAGSLSQANHDYGEACRLCLVLAHR